jgi:hypothetical protein
MLLCGCIGSPCACCPPCMTVLWALWELCLLPTLHDCLVGIVGIVEGRLSEEEWQTHSAPFPYSTHLPQFAGLPAE